MKTSPVSQGSFLSRECEHERQDDPDCARRVKQFADDTWLLSNLNLVAHDNLPFMNINACDKLAKGSPGKKIPQKKFLPGD